MIIFNDNREKKKLGKICAACECKENEPLSEYKELFKCLWMRFPMIIDLLREKMRSCKRKTAVLMSLLFVSALSSATPEYDLLRGGPLFFQVCSKFTRLRGFRACNSLSAKKMQNKGFRNFQAEFLHFLLTGKDQVCGQLIKIKEERKKKQNRNILCLL